MNSIIIQITPIGECKFMYPNSDNIIWFLQKYCPDLKIKNIYQVIHKFPGENIVFGFATLEYNVFFIPSFISNLLYETKIYNFTKDTWRLSIYTLSCDPRLGSFASIKTSFIYSNQTFLELMEDEKDDIEKYLLRAKNEFRDYISKKVVGLFSLN